MDQLIESSEVEHTDRVRAVKASERGTCLPCGGKIEIGDIVVPNRRPMQHRDAKGTEIHLRCKPISEHGEYLVRRKVKTLRTQLGIR